MFWDKKDNKSSLPDLPPAKEIAPISIMKKPEMEEDDSEEMEKHDLPSFPDSPMKKGFSQAAIKDAINTEDEGAEEVAEAPSKTFKTVELEEESPIMPPLTKRVEVSRQIVKAVPQKSPNADIFVKIDKYYSARRALDETKMKLDEIDDVLRKIRETKMREEQELANWEKELAAAKERIGQVTENIFEKI